MPTSFPGSRDNLTNPTAADALSSAVVPHATQHTNANDAIEAIEDWALKIGTPGGPAGPLTAEGKLPASQSATNVVQRASGVTPQTAPLADLNVEDYAATTAQQAVLGNAASKPLSNYYATLADAQVAYPHAAALTDELDWAVLQAAFKAAGAATLTATPTGSHQVASAPAVTSPNAHYVLNRAITFTTAGLSYARFISDGRVILTQTDATKDIIDFRGAIRFEAEGIIFSGGKRHFLWGNNNIDASQSFFDRCEFHNSADWSTETTLTGSWGTVANMSANLLYSRCRWANNNRLVKNAEGIFAMVEDSWVSVKAATAADGAQWENRNELHLNEVYAVPPQSGAPANAHWVDNYGQFYSDGSRFGGEGAGLPVVWNYAGPQTVYPYNLGGVVSIRGGYAAIGPDTGPPAKGLVHLKTHLPQLIDIEGNFGITRDSGPIVVDGITGGLPAYIANLPATNVVCYVNLQGNVAYQAADLRSVPSALYTNPLKVRFNAVPMQVVGDDGAEGCGMRFVNIAGGTAKVWRWAAGQEGVSHTRFSLRDVTNGRDALVINPTPALDETNFWLVRNLGGVLTIQVVSQGAVDSGGAGRRVLTIPN